MLFMNICVHTCHVPLLSWNLRVVMNSYSTTLPAYLFVEFEGVAMCLSKPAWIVSDPV